MYSFSEMAATEEKLYPNCDATVWLRSCEEEVSEPLEGTMTGMLMTIELTTIVNQKERYKNRGNVAQVDWFIDSCRVGQSEAEMNGEKYK